MEGPGLLFHWYLWRAKLSKGSAFAFLQRRPRRLYTSTTCSSMAPPTHSPATLHTHTHTSHGSADWHHGSAKLHITWARPRRPGDCFCFSAIDLADAVSETESSGWLTLIPNISDELRLCHSSNFISSCCNLGYHKNFHGPPSFALFHFICLLYTLLVLSLLFVRHYFNLRVHHLFGWTACAAILICHCISLGCSNRFACLLASL